MTERRSRPEEKDYEMAMQNRQLSKVQLFARVSVGTLRQRHSVVKELHERGGRDTFLLAKKLCSSSEEQDRDVGAALLGQLGGESRPYAGQSVPILTKLLDDPKKSVRASAVAALGHVGMPTASSHLIERIADRSKEVRASVAFALASFEGSDVISALLTLSADVDDEVRSWAALSLGKHVHSNAFVKKRLRQLLKDSSEDVRDWAADALST